MLNTRDEPHADPRRYRRLHVIVGDSNMSEVTTMLKVGSTHLVLAMIECGTTVPSLRLESPIRAIRQINRDLTGRCPVRLADGRTTSPLEIQRTYLARVMKYVDRHGTDAATERVIDVWRRGLDAIESQHLSAIEREIDWVTKYCLVERYCAAHDLSLADARVAQLDLAYHDIRRGRGIFDLLRRKGLVERAVDDAEIERAKDTPPQTTRAKIRSEFIAAAERAGRPYTADRTQLKLNDPPRPAVMCQDPFSPNDTRVEQLVASLRPSRRRGRIRWSSADSDGRLGTLKATSAGHP